MTERIDVAVILAAGRGTRFDGPGKVAPKGFIRVGRRPIIEESVRRLVNAGIEKVVLVTGFMAEAYEEWAADYPNVETLRNARYAESGSMYSLYQARDAVDGDFLLLESDLVYESRALTVLLDTTASSALLASGETDAGDEVWVEARKEQLWGLSKDRTKLGSIFGEMVGITRIGSELFDVMCDLAEKRFEETLMVEYESVLAEAARRLPVRCERVADLVWGEIDTTQHLDRVRRSVYPKLSEEG